MIVLKKKLIVINFIELGFTHIWSGGMMTEGNNTQSGGGAGKTEGVQMPDVNFSTFVFSLNSSALVNLGVISDPVSGKKDKQLLLAKQTIDIIGMLHDKTKGNLSDDEEKLITNILHDLRLMYVKESQAK